MKIALDAMGGDKAPAEIVAGAMQAIAEQSVEIVLVGDAAAVQPLLSPNGASHGIALQHASEVIGMGEPPLASIRKKRDSSICVAVDLLAQGEVQGLVTAGETGAAMAAATMKLGRIPGIDRPAIASVLPTIKGHIVVLDVGANVDTKPLNLMQFGIMGSLYAQCLLGVRSPRVGLLSIGEEATKGNELTRAAFKLMRNAPYDFYGNVEGRDIALGTVDVVVCDGFVGNTLLKTAEGYGQYFAFLLRQELLGGGWLAKLGALLLRPNFRHLRERMDYQEYGGGLLLGVNGVCIISHGSSNARAVARAIHVARQLVETNIVERIRQLLPEVKADNGQAAAMSN